MTSTIVDDFYYRNTQLLNLLRDKREVSLYVWSSDYLRRFLVLVAANYFETEVREIMRGFIDSNTNNPLVVSFLQKSMERQYHTYFEWEGKNANRFFSMFGDNFKRAAVQDVAADPDLNEAIGAFLELGQTRNELIHKRINAISLIKTTDEYFELHKKALIFVNYVKRKLRQSACHAHS